MGHVRGEMKVVMSPWRNMAVDGMKEMAQAMGGEWEREKGRGGQWAICDVTSARLASNAAPLSTHPSTAPTSAPHPPHSLLPPLT